MSWCHKALREPLLHFVAGGTVLFLTGQAMHARSDTHHIVITREEDVDEDVCNWLREAYVFSSESPSKRSKR